MRDWSFFMILEHNAIVNRTISTIVRQLAHNEPLSGLALIDPKSGVMPSTDAGPEWVGRFRDFVDAHGNVVATLGNLRGTRTSTHPVFGMFDAHRWNCMFAFHLRIPLPQAECVVLCFLCKPIISPRSQ